MPKIKKIIAREILDARGWPTLEVEVFLEKNISARASVPGSVSVGSYEARELRDGDHKRYQGQGVLKAVSLVNELISSRLAGKDIADQSALDKLLIELDGSKDKSKIGANTLLAVSLACARAGAAAAGKELFAYLRDIYGLAAPKLPVPMFNLFCGGQHADTSLDFEEFLIIPKRNKMPEMIRQGAEIFQALGEELRAAGYDSDVGLEGGYAPDLDSSIAALELIMAASLRSGYQPGKDVNLGIDIGSSILFDVQNKRYVFPLDKAYFSAANLIGLYDSWLKRFPISYLEDPLAEDDWDNWHSMTAELGGSLMIAGDDLFATNSERLRRGLQEKTANAITIKPGQAGTLTETVECIKLANKHNYRVIVSQRSGETNDDFIADLAVAAGADYLKAGSLSRGERVAKYNRLLAIAAILESDGK